MPDPRGYDDLSCFASSPFNAEQSGPASTEENLASRAASGAHRLDAGTSAIELSLLRRSDRAVRGHGVPAAAVGGFHQAVGGGELFDHQSPMGCRYRQPLAQTSESAVGRAASDPAMLCHVAGWLVLASNRPERMAR